MTIWHGAFGRLDSHQKELVIDALVLLALERRSPLSDAQRRGLSALLEELGLVAGPGRGDRALGEARDRLTVTRSGAALRELARWLADEIRDRTMRGALLAATIAVAATVPAPLDQSPSPFLRVLHGALRSSEAGRRDATPLAEPARTA